jgi:threonine/homoserine/homoserine lactone efflux protein
MLAALASGFLLGLSCGLAPGPLLMLVLSQTLRHGTREGCKVAVAPLLSDAPIIILTWLLVSRAAHYQAALAALSLAGGLFVIYLAFDSFRPVPMENRGGESRPQSWFKGGLVNLLSPHPWLFWMTIGAATLARTTAVSTWAAAAFLLAFYACLIGSKLLLALVSGRCRNLLSSRAYALVLKSLGLLLALFGAILIRDGIQRLLGS